MQEAAEEQAAQEESAGNQTEELENKINEMDQENTRLSEQVS